MKTKISSNDICPRIKKVASSGRGWLWLYSILSGPVINVLPLNFKPILLCPKVWPSAGDFNCEIQFFLPVGLLLGSTNRGQWNTDRGKKELFSSQFVFWQRASKGFSVLEGPIHQCSLTVALTGPCSKWPLASSFFIRVADEAGTEAGTTCFKFCGSHTLCSKIQVSTFLPYSLPPAQGVVAFSCNCHLCYTSKFSFTPCTY